MRSLTTAARNALMGSSVPVAMLMELLTTPAVRLCSASASLTVGADTYLGQGSLGGVEAVVDSAGGGQALRFALSGVPSDLIALALSEDVRGKVVNLRLAVLDPATHAVLDSPLLRPGAVDQMVINHGPETSTIGVTSVHRSETFRRPKPLRYTDNDQQLVESGDTSMRYIVSQAQVQDVWPAASYFRV